MSQQTGEFSHHILVVQLGQILEQVNNLPDWVWGIPLVLGIGWVMWRVTMRFSPSIKRLVRRYVDEPALGRLAFLSARFGIVTITVVTAAQLFGFKLITTIQSAGAVTAAIGSIAALFNIGRFASGLPLLLDRPYSTNDMIQFDNRVGIVEEITLRNTKIYTFDNGRLIIPNSRMRTYNVIRNGDNEGRYRRSLSFSVTYESDLNKAKRIAIEAVEREMKNNDKLLDRGGTVPIVDISPTAKPVCRISECADSGVRLTLRYWVRTPYKALNIHANILENIYHNIDNVGNVDFAYPHTHHVFDDDSGTMNIAIKE